MAPTLGPLQLKHIDVTSFHMCFLSTLVYQQLLVTWSYGTAVPDMLESIHLSGRGTGSQWRTGPASSSLCWRRGTRAGTSVNIYNQTFSVLAGTSFYLLWRACGPWCPCRGPASPGAHAQMVKYRRILSGGSFHPGMVVQWVVQKGKRPNGYNLASSFGGGQLEKFRGVDN